MQRVRGGRQISAVQLGNFYAIEATDYYFTVVELLFICSDFARLMASD